MDTSSIFKPYHTYNSVRGNSQTVIKNSIGRQLPYIVNFKRNTCQIFDVELEKVTHAYDFPDSCSLISVDHFPTTTGTFGVIVGVEDKCMTWGAEHFVVALTVSQDTPTMVITGMLEVPERITIVKTIFSNADMVEGKKDESLGLYPRLLEWPHIIAIGCKRSKCYVTSLLELCTSTEDQTFQVPKKKMLELMNSYVSNGVFKYTCDDDGAFREYPADGVYVSAIALMPRSRTLLVGLSMGGILAAALNPSNQMNLLELRHERLINDIAPLEPEDDPDKYEYFIAAVDRSSRHNIMIQLFRGSFKSMDEVNDEEKYDRVLFNVCLEHKISFGERWLSVKTIVTERGSVDGWSQRRRNDSSMDSMILNASQNFGCTSNRSNVLLAYERRAIDSSPTEPSTFTVEASIFDIDAWYYKRVPSKVTHDGTVLRQCAFMSCIRSEISSDQVTDVGILTSDSTSLTRFSSMISDADQLFYPSSMSYDRVFVIEKDKISWMKIQSVQETILEKCASKLPWVVRSPDAMAANIISAGLIRKNVLTGSPNTSASEIVDDDLKMPMNLRVVLNAMMYYGKVEEFIGLISRSDLSDKIKTDIADWAFFEAVDYKRIISDRTVSLFHGVTAALSPLAEDTVNQGIKLFRIVHEYIRSCSQSMKEAGNLRKLALSAKCLLSHTKLVSRFINVNIVPVNHHIQNKMRQMHEKRKNIALKNRSVLPVQINVRNMHRLTSEARFWNDLPYEDWYPPTPLDLLESILNISIPERVKREVVTQYVLDWLRASEIEVSEKELAIEVIKVMTNQMLGVDLERIYVVMDEEKKAFKPSITVESAEEKARKKVFSTEEDGLTYEQLWNGELHLTATFKSSDVERFKQRMIAEESKEKKLPVLDPESEKLYQAFLFENEKYDLMSSEAVESHQLLSSFVPRLITKKSYSDHPTSAKEKEIQRSVKEMFQKHQKKEEQQFPEMFATVDKANGRKRRSQVTEPNTSPVIFVPPTVKRIQHQVQESGKVHENFDPETDISVNNTLNQMIATPARYYKRPIEPIGMSSPTEHQKQPPIPKQTSILKTAKPTQSPSRGRIRFHASVRKGPNESIESIGEEENVEEKTNEIKQINFAILGDLEEEEDVIVRRSRSNSKAPETEQLPEEPFEVLEEVEEETFELQDDVEEGVNDKLIPEAIEKVVESHTPAEPIVESDEKSEDAPVEAMVENEQLVEIYEDAVSGNEVVQVDVRVEAQEMEYEEAQWDGVERSFEVQKDEDCLLSKPPTTNDLIEEEIAQMEVDDDIAHDIALDKTFEAQEEEDEPRPLGDSESAESSSTVSVKPKASTALDVDTIIPDMDRPPSANTRSKARAISSRSATPVEDSTNEKQNEAKHVVDNSTAETEKIASKKNVRRTRSSSRRVSPKPEEETDEQELPSTSRTRSESARNPVVVDKPEVEEKKKPKATATPRAPSASRTRLTSKVVEEAETPIITTGRVTRSRTNSRSQTPARTLEEANVPDIQSADGNTTPAKEEDATTFDVTGSVLLKRVSKRISTRASSVVRETSTPVVASAKKSTRAPPASAPTTPRRGRQKSESEKPDAKPKGSAKRQVVVPVDTPREEPAKKTRGLSRSTPLKVIPESGEAEPEKITCTPKRGRPRNNSASSATATTSSSAPSTPKRGRKLPSIAPTLGDVDEERVQEPSTPTRRSARRLQQQPQP